MKSKNRLIHLLWLALICGQCASWAESPATKSSILSTQPTDAELSAARVFDEPLVPLSTESNTRENQALANALTAYSGRVVADDCSSLAEFANHYPQSRWTASLLLNLGTEYYNYGYYSKTLDAWERAWTLCRDVRSGPLKPEADRALGELARMYSKLGRMTELSRLLDSTTNRNLAGPGTQLIHDAKDALWMMQNQPGFCFKCGPLALERIQARQDPTKAGNAILMDSRSTTNGFSLLQVADLSRQVELNYQIAFRNSGAVFVLPAVIHWKVGHYAALMTNDSGHILVQDFTFHSSLWMTTNALDEEGSGYFLLPPGPLPEGWRAVSAAEAQTIWGKGITGAKPPGFTTKKDKTTGGTNANPCGMAVYTMHAMLVSLAVNDEPIWYTPPVGPQIGFIASYHQLEANQPSTFSYSDLGQKWTCNWISYITDNPGSPNADVAFYVDGGGTLNFTGFDPASQSYTIEVMSQSQLVKLTGSSYELRDPDGSRRQFAQSDGSTGSSRRIFLTKVIDPFGNSVQLNYDSQLRITNIVDAIGQSTTLLYTNTAYPYAMTGVSDPFGRSASFLYDASGMLIQITDMLGLVSQFTYGANQFMSAMQTPYGVTTFSNTQNNGVSTLWATDPLGQTEMLQYNQNPVVPHSYPASQVPHGLSTFNLFLDARNSFFWSKKAYAEGPGDYSKARIYHWLHYTPIPNDTAPILESVKDPLESRVWYNYAGQSTNYGAPYYLDSAYTGTTLEPSVVARLLDDGSTQIYLYGYNALGNVTNFTDPVGRTFTWVYASNNVDVLETRMTRNGKNELLRRATYNSQHEPLTITDASGQATTNTYNARGQLVSSINPLEEMTTLSYSSNGYLTAITGPLQNSNDVTAFTYDGFGRVRTMTDSEGYTVTYDYDALDRTTEITYPDGTFEQFVYTILDNTASRDRMGRWTTNAYNPIRQLIQTRDPLGRLTRFEWCNCGSLENLIDALGRTTTWQYDVQGRLGEKKYTDGSSVSYQYESSSGLLKVRTDEKGQETVYDYYHDNHLRQVSYLHAAVPTPAVAFTYDPDYERLQTMSDGMGTTTYTYNPITPTPMLGAGRLSSISGPLPNITVTYQYDQLGRPIIRAINGVSQILTFDNLGRPTHVTNSLGAFGYSYVTGTTRLAAEACPNRQTNLYSYYDNLGDQRLQQIVHLKPDGSLLSGFGLAYNPAGELISCTNRWDTLPTRVWMYSYDAADQLTAAIDTDGVNPITPYTYAYDPVGNRTMATTGATTNHFSYNALNQIVGSDATLAGNFSNEWDAANRLTAINLDNQRTEFSYDGLGRRLRIVEMTNGVVNTDSYFFWCGTELCEQRDATGSNVLRRFFPQGEVIGHAGTTNLYYTRDHLDSVREAMDGSGTLQARYDYDPYGAPTPIVETLKPAFAFGGYYFHRPSGLSLAFYRALNHQAGRWLSRDPLGESISYNQYSYVANNPVNWLDPLGLYAEVVVEGNKVTITIPIEYQGPGASPEVIAKFNDGIRKLWNGRFGKYDVVVKVYIPSADCPKNKKNVIQVPIGDTRAYVDGEGGRTGEWPSQRPAWTAAHEAGHLMGLPDRYDDEKGAHEGYEHDIMGARDQPPSETDITQIIEANKGK